MDARAVARAALQNLRKGRIAEGGSTITQQLVKNRDLTPKRSLGRKATEAMLALALEAEHDKREILQAYLNAVYLGHAHGRAVRGVGAAARAWFSKPAQRLTLAEAAALAAMNQGPNRLSPVSDAGALRQRRDWVLSRMAETGPQPERSWRRAWVPERGKCPAIRSAAVQGSQGPERGKRLEAKRRQCRGGLL